MLLIGGDRRGIKKIKTSDTCAQYGCNEKYILNIENIKDFEVSIKINYKNNARLRVGHDNVKNYADLRFCRTERVFNVV